MALSPSLYPTLKADIAADGALASLPNDPDSAFAIAAAYNQPASPDYWVWRSLVSESEIYEQASVDGTTWSWPALIARTQGERDAWRQMVTMRGGLKPSLANVRLGVQDIFSNGPTGAAAQRTHLLTISRRKASRAEKLFAAGAGTTAAPSALGFEGSLTYQDVLNARAA